ncbi:MAG: extracellular solute-binding protein [Alphaproteobacteria bacterium]|nr:extracellular solute-binding protein [Alphaproteobacteria bacterium]
MKNLFVSVATACLTLASTALSHAQTVEIEYWQYFFKERVQAVDALIKTFEAANPGIKVKHTHFPYAQYQTKVAAAVPAGEGPDVVQLYYGWLEEYRKAKLIEPLPKDQFDPAQIERDFFPIVKAMKADGAYWGLPTAVRSMALFYNRKLMAEAGLDPAKPPATLDDLISQSAKIAKRDGGGNVLTAGLTVGPVSQDHHWWREVLVRQFGGQAFSDDNTKVAYDKKGGIEGLQFYHDIVAKHRLTTFGFMDESQAAFRAGKAGFHIDGSFRIGTFQAVRNLDWGVAELPSHNGVKANFASYWVNGVSSRAQGPRREAAMKFLKHLVSDEAMQLWLKTVGELPAKPSVAMTDANRNDPVYGPFILGLAYSYTTDFVNEAKQRQIFLDMMDRVDIKKTSVAEAIKIAAEEEQKLLDEHYKK